MICALPAARDRLPLATLLALFVGYAATYFHRADLPTLAPLLMHDGSRQALAAALPDIASLGMLVYAFGKVCGGWLADRWGGRRLFVFALAGATVAEAVASLCTAPVGFAACRVAGMLVLGCAWPALGCVAASVSPPVRLATVLAFLSQSYLLGDAAVRATLAAVVGGGGDTVAVLRTSTIGLLAATILVGSVLLLTRPRLQAPPQAAAAGAASGSRVGAALLWLALLNAALASVREALSLWSPTVLVAQASMPIDDAVAASALLPVASGLLALVAGPVADRSARTLFLVTFVPALLGAMVLAGLALGSFASPVAWVGLLCVASACLVVPMSLASGVLPLRAGGATGGGLRLGIVDGAGSAGGVLAGSGCGRIAAAYGTSAMFAVLSGLALLAAALAVVVMRDRRGRTEAAPPHR